MKPTLSEQEVEKMERQLQEALASSEDKQQVQGTFTVNQLRTMAAGLTTTEIRAIESEVSSLFPDREIKAARKRSIWNWKKSLAGLASAAIIFTIAPSVVRGTVDLPGIGVWIQQIALRDAGLEWAFEHGYMQGTVAQVSKNGVNLRVLGVAADPVQTTVIYLLQGVTLSGETQTVREEKAGEVVAAGNSRPYVSIRSVNGEGVSSWSEPPIKTPLGLVGKIGTWPLSAEQGTLQIDLALPDGSTTSLILEASREAVSRLSTIMPLSYEETIDGVTVTASQVIITPSQVRVDYEVRGGQTVQGIIPEALRTQLHSASGMINSSSGGGSGIEGGWKLSANFTRPRSLKDMKFVIPALSRPVSASVEWQIGQGQREASVGATTIEMIDYLTHNTADGRSISFKLAWNQTSEVWSLSKVELVDANGRVESMGPTGWQMRPDDKYFSLYSTIIPDDFHPVLVRATEVQALTHGNWAIELPNN